MQTGLGARDRRPAIAPGYPPLVEVSPRYFEREFGDQYRKLDLVALATRRQIVVFQIEGPSQNAVPD